VRESRTLGSVGAKAEWLSYPTVHAMTCVMALVSYSSPERYESKNAFSRRTRSACTDTAWRPSETPRRARPRASGASVWA